MEVKGELEKNRHFSAHQSSQLNAHSDIQRQGGQSGLDGQKSDPEYPPRHLLEKLIRVPISAGYKGTKIPGHYYLWAVLDAYQGDDGRCFPSQLLQALNCRVGERQIRRWLAKLKADKNIGIDRRGKFHRYSVHTSRKITTFVPVDPRWVWKFGLSINEAVLFGYVCFRLNHKQETWFSIRRAAWDLGLSYNTIRRCLAVLAAESFIKIRPGRLSRGRTNRYQLTSFGWLVSWENYPKQARPKCPVKRNTIPEGCYSYANAVRNGSFRTEFGLSFSTKLDQELYELLVKFGASRQGAKLRAVQWRGYEKSVQQAIINAAYRFEADAETLRRHNLEPLRGTYISYGIGTLDRAYSEGHRVKPSKLARAVKARDPGGARAAAGGPPPEAELKQLEQYAENVLKPDLEKLHTPGKSAIPAQYTPICDKKAQDALLTRTLETAKRNWAAHHKPANPPQKADFSLDKPG